eukprot:scaffold73185_cov31-Tisochrysis_lutea.AAC.3
MLFISARRRQVRKGALWSAAARFWRRHVATSTHPPFSVGHRTASGLCAVKTTAELARLTSKMLVQLAYSWPRSAHNSDRPVFVL